MRENCITGSEIRNYYWTMRGIKAGLVQTALLGILLASNSLTEQGIVAFEAGHYSVALEELKNSRTDDVKAQTFLGLTEAALEHCDTALPKLLAIRENHIDLYRLANLAAAKCYGAANQYDQTFSLLDKLQHKFPNDADVLYLTAKLHMKAFNDATYAMFRHTPSSYRVHELSADIFEVENRYGDAASEYRKAIELNPSAPDLRFRLGRALLLESHSSESLQSARQAFQDELKVSPEDGACEYQLGQIAQVEGKKNDAKAHLERAVALSPNFVQALIALGRIDTQEKQFDRATARLKRAVELQPTNETAHYALLTAYRDSGDLDRAKAEKAKLDQLQKQPEGEFTDFLNKLGEKPKQ